MSANIVDEPADIPPAGQKLDFDVPNPIYPSILVCVVLCTILTTLFAAARLTTKHVVSRLDLEDYLLILAWVANVALDYTLLAAAQAGLGHHLWNIRLIAYPKVAQFTWALEILYIPTIWLAKASLIFQLIHIFTPLRSGPIYWACHALIWGNLVFYIAVLFTVIFECHPISEVWNLFYGDHCINRNTVLVASGAVNIFSDLLNLLLPIWATWHLQMAPKRKAGIVAIFATGLLALVSSILRLVYSAHIITSTDVSYIVAQTALWGLAEIAAIILCTCFPMLPRLVRLLRTRFSSSTPSSSSTSRRRTPWRKPAKASTSGGTSSDAHGASSNEEATTRFYSPYERLEEDGDCGSGPSGQEVGYGETQRVDIELMEREERATDRST